MINHTITILAMLLQSLPVGTNLALLTSVRVRQPERAKCLSREKVSWVDDNTQSDRKAD